MKFWLKTTLFMTSLILLLSGIAAQTTAAQTQSQENLLANPGFEAGHYKQDGISEITVPNSWRMHWLDNVTFAGSGEWPAYRPETVVWDGKGGAAIPEGEEVFWRDGNFTLKIFKGWAPLYAALSQDVGGLQVGRSYRLVAPVFPDLVVEYVDGKKVPPWQQDSGLVRLGASQVGATWRDETAIAYSGFWTAESIPNFYLNMNVYVYDFTATAETMTVWVEVVAREPLPNNGFFIDGLGLYALETVAPVPVAVPVDPNAPTATPRPTPTPRADGAIIHVVQGGDSFWGIAIQYASALGVTPEEALTIIQEKNNNPAFINVGQELLILEPSTAAAPVAAPTTTTEETEASEETAETAPDTRTAEVQEIAAVPQGGSELPSADAATATVCVTAFEDQSGDGARAADSEGLLSDAALTLSRGGSAVATYVSDGLLERYCFESLEPDTYQIQFFPPANYRPTTQDNGWIALSGGTTIPIIFGAQLDETAVAAQSNIAPLSVSDTAVAPDQAAESGGLPGITGTVILGVAIVLLILAGVGVVLLRRA